MNLTWSDCRRDTTIEFMEALPPVVDRLMSLFALGIGFREDYFKDVRPFRWFFKPLNNEQCSVSLSR